MTFYNIEDLNSFFQEIDTCEGGILLKTGDGENVDLRHNAFAQTLLKTSGSERGLARLDLTIESPVDTVRLLNFMMAGPRDVQESPKELVCA